MDIIDPINAARIIVVDVTLIFFPIKKTITRATTILAPEEIPRTKGPAIGLLKNVCKRYPARERAPPSIKTAAALGSRISQRIFAMVSLAFCPASILMVFERGIWMLPIQIFKRKKSNVPIPRNIRTIRYRYVLFLFLSLHVPGK